MTPSPETRFPAKPSGEHETSDIQIGLPRPRRTGPVAARKVRRTLTTWLALWSTGPAAVLASAPTGITAVALSLANPGGGLWYTGHPILAVLGLAGFVVAVFAWWAAGPALAPILVWAGLAVLPLVIGTPSTSTAGTVIALTGPPILLLVAALSQEWRFRGQARRGADLADRLARERFTITGTPAGRSPVTESSPEDLAALRYALDLALQPVDEFAGFTRIDQFRESALRYQLNSLGYALATAQFTRTPAFTGYLAEAQRNAIAKMLDRRVFGYWAVENLWGNLRWNPDPVLRENIMLTGFLGVQAGMYATLNDDRFAEPGALTFRYDDRHVYPNSFSTLAESIHRNLLGSDFTLFPCKPNWIYSVCNTFGLNTLISHDRLCGTELTGDVLDRLRHAYETEFLRPDGRIIGVRAQRLGLSWNLWAGPVIGLTSAFWLHAGLPDLAQRAWWIVRDQEIRLDGDRCVLPVRASSRLDPGNYRLGSTAYGLNMVAMTARELGDDEYARAATAGLEEHGDPVQRDGVRRYAGLSGLGNLYALQHRFNRRSGLRDLITYGGPAAWQRGPVLGAAAYPDVLVARAETDGAALHLVLRPGAGPVRTTLGIERLRPNREYAVTGATTDRITASDTGAAIVELDLGDRRELSITPR
ncbi:hypothetical protein [Skermania piniformis]|uniref:Linalool dehydratase/isomerase domain-containing protein n=1 Tax=Skermania pinensis TaxID=39122 RepID=A0ABX8S9D0_9ACTN|nr:hypothetical protein [Skermania piniformis]QXQ12331.1 hypothetical protein KV203_09975 [Skermania piniformis]